MATDSQTHRSMHAITSLPCIVPGRATIPWSLRARLLEFRPMTESDPSGSLFTDRTFNDLDLPLDIRRAVDDLGFRHLTKVQAEVLAMSLAGRDIVAQAHRAG